MPRITIMPEGRVVETSAAVSILNALLRDGVAINHRCGGKAQCGTCAIRVIEGEGHTSPIREREAGKLRKFAGQPSVRLACQTHIYSDVTIEIMGKRTTLRRPVV